MSALHSENQLLAMLARAEHEGLNVNRLLFVRWLVLSGRLSDQTRDDEPEVRGLQAA